MSRNSVAVRLLGHLLTFNPMDTVGGTDLGMSFLVAVLGGLVMVILLIRALPRWYAAQFFSTKN
ncbi:hypothetical protein [Alkalibacterium sp. AK22]|uniref:hypothetical protein n=1 Tax=Alkalibacterium sp. AK22 TaxID=1229520 RepID=UPI0012DDA1F3|nr:hypothetical protein [Alkalibacterium sp. AK22]